MGIIGLKSLPSKLKAIVKQEHMLLPVLEAWKDARFRKYKRRTILERWTIDRHDTENGVVRIERVSAQKTLEELVKELLRPDSSPPDFDRLEWWDADSTRNEHMDAAKLAEVLNLADLQSDGSPADNILENAVYMVLVHTKQDKAGKITETIVKCFPSTTYARNLAKRMYEDLISGNGPKGGTP